MKKASDFLFWIGVVVTLIGVTIGQSQRIPFVLRLVVPSYARASDAAKKLTSGPATIEPNDVGFGELATLYTNRFRSWNPQIPSEAWAWVKILKIQSEGGVAAQAGPGGSMKMCHSTTAHMSDGQQLIWNCEDLQAEAEKWKDNSLVAYAVSISIIGQIISIASWWHKKRLERANERAKAENTAGSQVDAGNPKADAAT